MWSVLDICMTGYLGRVLHYNSLNIFTMFINSKLFFPYCEINYWFYGKFDANLPKLPPLLVECLQYISFVTILRPFWYLTWLPNLCFLIMIINNIFISLFTFKSQTDNLLTYTCCGVKYTTFVSNIILVYLLLKV